VRALAGADRESAAARAATLAKRAQDIAREESAEDPRELAECLVFDLASQNYAIDIAYVREVHSLKSLTPIPCAPSFVLGIIAVRGQLYPVLDLQGLLAVPERRLANATRSIILGDASMEFGIVADAIRGVRRLGAADLSPPPAILPGSESRFVRGLTRDRIVLLDAPSILAHPGLIVNEEVAS
jgi:purine-binding chemotaxis protein CheW